MIFGYARVSTQEQDLALQRAELTRAGCVKIFAEKVSGAAKKRPQLAALLDRLAPGDVVVVTRLDRLARSTSALLTTVDQIAEAGAGFRSIAEQWADTTTPAGRMVMTIFAGIAEFERSLILERTSAGRALARERGQRFGRPKAVTDEDLGFYGPLIEGGNKSVREVAKVLKVSPATIYRRLARDAMASDGA